MPRSHSSRPANLVGPHRNALVSKCRNTCLFAALPLIGCVRLASRAYQRHAGMLHARALPSAHAFPLAAISTLQLCARNSCPPCPDPAVFPG
eukprot:scaffold64257_cov19-Tisochrysis_lutea.AAC.1